ncbi:hypothetical protein [Marinicella litoralis]|nr:hypothetical protein [Marinicella litoralis]
MSELNSQFKQCLSVSLLLVAGSIMAQEINWYSIDNGGGVSSNGMISLTGVMGQTDVVLMEGGSVSVAGGFLPVPADLIFENQFD